LAALNVAVDSRAAVSVVVGEFFLNIRTEATNPAVEIATATIPTPATAPTITFEAKSSLSTTAAMVQLLRTSQKVSFSWSTRSASKQNKYE